MMLQELKESVLDVANGSGLHPEVHQFLLAELSAEVAMQMAPSEGFDGSYHMVRRRLARCGNEQPVRRRAEWPTYLPARRA